MVTIPELIPVTKPLASIVTTLLSDEVQLPPGFPVVLMDEVPPTHIVVLFEERVPASAVEDTVIVNVSLSVEPPQFDEVT
jgi:hypothetical protein